jgi:phage gp29-like protein
MTDLIDRFNTDTLRSGQSRAARRFGAREETERYRASLPSPYEGMQLVVRPSRPFAIGHRSAHMDTLFGNYIDLMRDPSRARQKDPDIGNRMRQDLQVLGCLNVRKLATVQLRREFQPANSSPEAAIVSARFDRLWRQQYREGEAVSSFLDAILDGIVIQEAVWERNEDDFTLGIGRLFPVYKDRFAFSKDGQLALLTRHNVFYGDRVHPWQFFKHVYNPTGGSWNSPTDEGRLYWGRGLEDSIYPTYYFKTVVLSLFTRWLQRLSGGVLVGRYPYKDPTARGVALELLEAYQNDEELAYPSGEEWGIEIHEATRAPADTFMSFIEYADRQMSKAILGSTLIIDQGDVGTQSLGEVHERTTFGRIAEFDRMGFVETVNSEVVPVIGQLNQIPKQLWPKFMMPLDETSPARLQILEAYQLLQSLGFDVSAEMVTETTGFRRPKPGETMLALPMPQGMDSLGKDASQESGGGSPLSRFDLATPEGLERFRSVVFRSGHGRGRQTYSLSAGGLREPHRHSATLDAHGNGRTDAGPGGHWHDVRSFRCQPSDQHTHDVLVSNHDMDRVMRALAGG